MTQQIEIRPIDTPDIHESRVVRVDVESNLRIPVQDSKRYAEQTVDHLIIKWMRFSDGPWELSSILVRGHRIRQDGSVGKAQREAYYASGRGARQWILDFIEQYRPAGSASSAPDPL